MINVIMQSVSFYLLMCWMVSVIILSVVRLNVVVPYFRSIFWSLQYLSNANLRSKPQNQIIPHFYHIQNYCDTASVKLVTVGIYAQIDETFLCHHIQHNKALLNATQHNGSYCSTQHFWHTNEHLVTQHWLLVFLCQIFYWYLLLLLWIFERCYAEYLYAAYLYAEYLYAEQAWAIQMTATLDGKVILVPPNFQNFVPSSFSYLSWEIYFV